MNRTILSPLTLSLLSPLLTLACDPEDTTEVHHLDDLDEAIDDVTADAEDEARPSLSLTRLNHDCAGLECAQKTVSQWVEMVEGAEPRNWWRTRRRALRGRRPLSGEEGPRTMGSQARRRGAWLGKEQGCRSLAGDRLTTRLRPAPPSKPPEFLLPEAVRAPLRVRCSTRVDCAAKVRLPDP